LPARPSVTIQTERRQSSVGVIGARARDLRDRAVSG